MRILTERYVESQALLPADGRHIVAHQQEGQVVVYQAYNVAIAEFAVARQQLGGPAFSYSRMSWIKPNFLWMMYRCGWGSKENQERVLALWLDTAAFDEILGQAAFSTFTAGGYASEADWKKDLASSEVRLQWDPDHDPYGAKMPRRAIQLGLKGKALEKFGTQQVRLIEDVTDFVHAQKQHVDGRELDQLLIPQERVYVPANPVVAQKIGITPVAG